MVFYIYLFMIIYSTMEKTSNASNKVFVNYPIFATSKMK